MSLSGYDAAYPPPHPPATDIVLGYLGGDTPYVWTPANWRAQQARYRVGIWTRSNPTGATQGASEGRSAASLWLSLGAPSGSTIALDFETAVDAAYVLAFDKSVRSAGLYLMLYGSKSTLFQNPKPSGGYWVADYTNQMHDYPGASATQYEDVGPWDLNSVPSPLHLWDTRPVSPPVPPTTLDADVSHLISVTPDPSNPANPGHGLFFVDGGHVSHVASVDYLKALEAKYGPPLVATPGDYTELVASTQVAATVNVDPAALAAALAPLIPKSFTGTIA